MNVKPPKLRKHVRSGYIVKWAGRTRYLGHDPKKAQAAYLQELQAWADWREARETRKLPPLRNTAKVVDVAAQFLDYKETERGRDTRRYYAKHLKRFLALWGGAMIEQVKPVHIQMLKQDMIDYGFSPKTINHDLTAIKTFLRWAMQLELAPVIRLDGIRSQPLPPHADKSLDVKSLRALVNSLDADREKPWCAINYLAAMRPSEVVRVVHGQGDWVETGVFRLSKSKTDRFRQPRYVLFSSEAIEHLAKCRRLWSRLDSYSQAVRAACGVGPSRFRHSAAKHLHHLHGVNRQDVDLLLGHKLPSVSATYAPIHFEPLRNLAALLTLQSVGE